MASIDRWTGGKWRARGRGPKGERRAQGFDRKLDAERHLTAVEHSKITGSYVDRALGRRRFDDWWTEWFAGTVDLRPSTRARDESYARVRILPHFGARNLADIDHQSVRTWVAELSSSGL